jgi:hypothetical protein
MNKFRILFFLLVLCTPTFCADTVRGIMVRSAQIFLHPASDSPKVGQIDRGREVAILEDPGKGWIHVLATVSQNRYTGEERDISGWMVDKGVVRKDTPNGDRIVFGEAASSEAEASRRGGRKGADTDALRLYYRCSEYFPQSPLAGEALYRAADIRWQLDKYDVNSRPSARQRDPGLRGYGIDEEFMKEVRKKFPHSKWSDLAEFHLIENKLCGDWQSESKCPEKEAEMYEKYAEEHPQSPAVAEALYDAAWRRAALISIYPNEGKSGKVAEAKSRAEALCQRIATSFAQTDWAARAQALLFMVQQGVPTFGNQLQ